MKRRGLKRRRGMRLNGVYGGLVQDEYGGMNPSCNIIRDAWVFVILPEEETCAGWSYDRILALYDQVYQAWAPYGLLVSKLPEDLRRRHEAIYSAAVTRARELGWSAELGDDD